MVCKKQLYSKIFDKYEQKITAYNSNEQQPTQDVKNDEMKTWGNIVTGEHQQALKHIIERVSKIEGQFTSVPFYLNGLQHVRIYENGSHLPHVKLTLNNILRTMIMNILKIDYAQIDEYKEQILIQVRNPISTDTLQDSIKINNLEFNYNIVENDDHFCINIYDPILYWLVNQYGNQVMYEPIYQTYIFYCNAINKQTIEIPDTVLTQLFAETAEALYISTFVLKYQNPDINTFHIPSYDFLFGTLSTIDTTPGFTNIVNENQIILNLGLWKSIFSTSFTIVHEGTNYNFFKKFGTYLDMFNLSYNVPTLTIDDYWQKTTLTNVPIELKPHNIAKEYSNQVTEEDYFTTISERDEISKVFDDKKDFSSMKDKILGPKKTKGAVNKLESLVEQCNIHFEGQKILDIGVAPGTWSAYVLDHNPRFLEGITPKNNDKDLKMYSNVAQRYQDTKNAKLHYSSFADFNQINKSKYNLILSDAATFHSNYLTQAKDHDALYTQIIGSLKHRLYPGGSAIVKVYDLTTDLLMALKSNGKYFDHVSIIKPKFSCPSNPEQYIYFKNFSIRNRVYHDYISMPFNHLMQQKNVLLKILQDGYNLSVTKSHDVLKLAVGDVIHPQLEAFLWNIHLNRDIFCHHYHGFMSTYNTNDGSKYLSIEWNKHKECECIKMKSHNTIIIQRTIIGFQVNATPLTTPYCCHFASIETRSNLYSVVLINKRSSFLFSQQESDLIISNKGDVKIDNYIPLSYISCLSHHPFYYQYFTINNFNDFCKILSIIPLQFFLEYQQFLFAHIDTYYFKSISKMVSNRQIKYNEILSEDCFIYSNGQKGSIVQWNQWYSKQRFILECSKCETNFWFRPKTLLSIKFNIVYDPSSDECTSAANFGSLYKEYETNKIYPTKNQCYESRRYNRCKKRF